MDLEQYRQVINEAIVKEIESRVFYEDVAALIKDSHLKTVFLEFAVEEAKHERILVGVLKKERMEASYFAAGKDFKVSETIELPDVTPEMDLKSAIGLAMKREEGAMNEYLSLADNCQDASLKAVFTDLANMEKGHKFKMEEKFVNVAFPEVW